MLSEISQVVREKYMISPLTGTQSTREKSKQNITRDIEIKNNLTGTRREMGGDNVGKEGRVFRNNYKGHMDKSRRGEIRGGRWGWLEWGGIGGE